jgi:hypothetical protein
MVFYERVCINYLKALVLTCAMELRGRTAGVILIVLVALGVVFAIWYNHKLDLERAQAIAQLSGSPGDTTCQYDASTCPESDDTALPHSVAIGVVVLLMLIGLYMIRTDATQHRILRELEKKTVEFGKEERRTMMLSMLTVEERKVLSAIIDQPGISQSTLRIRTQTSKAKLSMLLKDFEQRDLIVKVEEGKTNKIHLKREL